MGVYHSRMGRPESAGVPRVDFASSVCALQRAHSGHLVSGGSRSGSPRSAGVVRAPETQRRVVSMTEVPEHLLQRSRERRAALGGESAPPAAPSGEGGAAASGGEVVPAAAAPAPAVVEEAAPPRELPPYVQAAHARKKLPRWMPAVGAAALLWVFIYAGVLF